MDAEHRDWQPTFDNGEGCWRVTRKDDQGRQVYGASTTGDGTPYRCCCKERAAAVAHAMNTIGHP